MNTPPPPKPPVMPLFSATHLRAALPPEMQALPQGVLRRYEERGGRWTKLPLYPAKHGLRIAKSKNPPDLPPTLSTARESIHPVPSDFSSSSFPRTIE